MLSLPVVSIVGRPNVGKSSLFNRILRKRIAVIDDLPGVTRDRNYAATSWNGIDFVLVDTGGIVYQESTTIEKEVHRQALLAIKESTVIVFLVESGTGPTSIDEYIARELRKHSSDKVLLAVNKSESKEATLDIGSFLSLGLGEPIFISAIHGRGVSELLDSITALITKSGFLSKQIQPISQPLKIAIVGRPNTGKSSLVNKILNQQRMIVDSTPGTTRDSIDTEITFDGNKIVIIDTAGLRRKSQVSNPIEYYCNLRAIESIQRSTVTVLMIDSVVGLGEQDLKIARLALQQHKGLIVCFNKWDLVEKQHNTFDRLVAASKEQYRELQHMPFISISALSGLRIHRILQTALQIKEKMTFTIAHSEFEDAVFGWIRKNPHPAIPGRQVRILGARQKEAPYPLFHFYSTNPSLVYSSYKRFLINNIYEKYGFEGCPVTIVFKSISKKHNKDNSIKTESANKE